MIIYLDFDFKCHVTNDGTMQEVETSFFDGKCATFIEGYRFVPVGSKWVREDGSVFDGEMISPWKPHAELSAAQRAYEQKTIQELQETVAELDAALLDSTYENIVGGI